MFTVFGGRLGPELDLTIEGQIPVPVETCLRNIDHSRSLSLPSFEPGEAAARRLVVVGGGPSMKAHVPEFRDYDGTVEIWAINGAWRWLKSQGVKATFLSIDPHPIVNEWIEGADKAILSATCDPGAFEKLKGRDLKVFEIGPHAIKSGSSTATVCPHLAFRMGYRSVTFFGCESSYTPAGSHAYEHEDRGHDELLIECDGGYYLTAPDFYVQAGELSRCIREVPEYLREESGGLLRAMIRNPETHIRWVSESLANALRPVERKHDNPTGI